MGIFDSFHINRAISSITDSADASAPQTDAVARLRDIGAAAVPKLVAALPQDQSNTLADLIGELVTNATLPVVVEDGLLNADGEVSNRVRRALAGAKHIDPNRLLELYVAKGGAIANIGDLLQAHKAALTAKSILRLLTIAHEDKQPAVFALIDRIADKAMVPAMIGFLKSAEWEGRFHIATTIARFPGEAVRDAFVRLLADPHKTVRQAALDGIATLGMPAPIGPICALLRDPDMVVQAKAIDALIKINDPDSVLHLLEILQDESEHVRRGAVEVLNAVGNADAIKDLLFAMKDKDWWVRVRAADALGAIGGSNVIDAVLQILGDGTGDEFMRRTAVEILNTTKDARAFGYLVKALKDADWWVRERAIDALANLGNKEAVPHLVSLLMEDNQTTPVAIRALAQLADPRAVPAIVVKFKSQDEMIQREAIEAVGALATPQQLKAALQRLRELVPINEDVREMAARVTAELAARHARRAKLRGEPTVSVVRTAAGSDARAQSATPAAAPAAEPVLEKTLECTMEVATPAGGQENTLKVDFFADASQAPAARSGSRNSGDFSQIEPGHVLGGRYRVVRELGRGGFGTVLQVSDQMVGEDIALKLINPHVVQDDSTIARFMHEVRYARRITHANVIRVYDFLMIDSYYAISMEYFASSPLSRRIRAGLHQQPARALKYVRDIARAIHVAHEADVMHRDLKPPNLLVNDDDILKIADFGLAAASSNDSSRVTKVGHLIGTPSYMSPEQVRGLSIDSRTDIYSLGVVMYEMFTGTVPYTSDNPMGVLYQHLEGTKELPRARNPLLSTEIEAVILKAMEVRPDDRYQTAHELLDALDAVDLKEAA